MANDETPNQETAIRVMRFAILAVVAIAQLMLVLTAAAVGDPRDIRVVLAATTILMLIPSVSLVLATTPDRRWRELGIRAFMPRLKIRTLMLLVLTAGLVVGAAVLQKRIAARARFCRDQAQLHAMHAGVQLKVAEHSANLATMLHDQRIKYPNDKVLKLNEREWTEESLRRAQKGKAENDLKEQFERAAKYPWFPVPKSTCSAR